MKNERAPFLSTKLSEELRSAEMNEFKRAYNHCAATSSNVASLRSLLAGGTDPQSKTLVGQSSTPTKGHHEQSADPEPACWRQELNQTHHHSEMNQIHHLTGLRLNHRTEIELDWIELN